MKKIILILIAGFCFGQTTFAQLSTMRACYPSANYKTTYDHFRDTIVFYSNGNKKYQFLLVDSTQGIYTDFTEKKEKLVTRLNYRFEKDTFYFIRLEIWKDNYLKTVAVYNDSATAYSAIYYFDESPQVWLKYNREVWDPERAHSGYFGLYQEFYLNGKLRLEGTFEDGARVGIWKNYYENGQMESMGNYTKSYTKFDCPMSSVLNVNYTFWDSRTKDTTVLASKGDGWDSDRDFKDKYEMERDGVQMCGGHIYYHRHGTWEYWSDTGVLVCEKKWKYGEMKKAKYFDKLPIR